MGGTQGTWRRGRRRENARAYRRKAPQTRKTNGGQPGPQDHEGKVSPKSSEYRVGATDGGREMADSWVEMGHLECLQV